MARQNGEFVHLHVHSEYSLLDGLSRIEHLAGRARELGQPALALTDHGTMYGTLQFYRACKRADVKPIIGVEAYLAARGMTDRDPQMDRERFHLLLLAQNETGYQNLLKLASAAQLEGFYYRPRIDHDFLAAHSEGLIATTGCLAAEVPRALHRGQLKQARRLMGFYRDVFGPERFFVELQEHDIPELTAVNAELLTLGREFGLEFVATNDVHYTTAAEAGPHDVLLCIQTGTNIHTKDRLRLSNQEYYLKSYEEMDRLFGHVPGALSNSVRIAEMCDLHLDYDGYHLPHFDVPGGYDARSYLAHLCQEGLVEKFGSDRAGSDETLHERLNHELSIIATMGFDTYFLIVWDLCQFARKTGIWWNVRGSGAASLVAFCLGITGIDPLANGLIFERFLNPGRVSMPDIDLDYPDDQRHEIVKYTVDKYGQDKVAQIITFGTMGARAAIRDVGRAMDMALPRVDELARMIPAIPGKPVRIRDVLNKGHEFYRAEFDEKYRADGEIRQLVETAINLEGVSRHASSHAAGVIISDRPLVEYLPLHRPTSGEFGLGGIQSVTQWPMEIVESIGLLKVDFLGLSTLTVLRQAAQLINERYQVRYTMDNIPYDEGHVGPDPGKKPEALFDMLGRGEVTGVFQVDGAGMRRLMMQMKPRRFDHIMAAISLYRPGPMENIPEYVARMHADDAGAVTYHTEDLKPILEETYGILVYQEQIIRIATELAGYEPGEADMIRKAVGKKKRKLLDAQRAKFIEGATARGYTEAVCQAIWSDIEFFARYGFNKAHAADYAVITCQTAFLKAHYPVEYMTALLSVERDNTDKVARYLAAARRMNIKVAPPDINGAGLDFTIEAEGDQPVIRYGMGAIKNAGEGAVQLIVAERLAQGPFRDLADLCQRVDLRKVGKRALESMTKVGVFDDWGERTQFLEALDRIIAYSGNTNSARAAGQLSLFGGASGTGMEVAVDLLHDPGQVPPIEHRQLLDWEKELIGFYLSEHPLERQLSQLENVVNATTADLDSSWHTKPVAIAGVVATLRQLTTKKGELMAFATLEDLTGRIELVFFPRIWRKVQDDVKVDQLLVVRGKAQVDEDRRAILVDGVQKDLTLAAEDRLAAPEHSAGTGVAAPESPPWDEDKRGQRPAPAATNAGHSPRREAASPAAGLRPPPPPNFEDSPQISESRAGYEAAGKAPGSQPGTLATTVHSNDFNLTDRTAGDGIAETDTPNGVRAAARSSEASAEGPETAPDSPKTPAAANGETTAADWGGLAGGRGNGRAKRVMVEVTPAGDWRGTCRRSLELASSYKGEDILTLQLTGQRLTMTFPNQRTHLCQELVEALEKLSGVTRVYEYSLPF